MLDVDGLSGFEEHLIGTSDLTANSGGSSNPADGIVAATRAQTHGFGLSTGGMPPPNLREVRLAPARPGRLRATRE